MDMNYTFNGKVTVEVQNSTGKAWKIGIQCGPLVLHSHLTHQKQLVLKALGYTGYVDRMTGSKNFPTMFEVYDILEKEERSDGDRTLFRLQHLFDFPLRPAKRA